MRHFKLRQQRKNVAHGAEPWVQSARERGEPRSGERNTLLIRPISVAPGGAWDTSRGSLSHGCRRGPHCIARQAGLQGRARLTQRLCPLVPLPRGEARGEGTLGGGSLLSEVAQVRHRDWRVCGFLAAPSPGPNSVSGGPTGL